MGFFDKKTEQPSTSIKPDASVKTQRIVFSDIPESIEEFQALPQAALSNPFDTTAMTVVALCLFTADKELCFKMLDQLRGPRPLNGMDKQFISDRFRGKDYIMRSYFDGAIPQNDYTPTSPYTVTVSSDPHSYDEPNIARLYVACGGADSPRPIKLRLAKDGKWYLWEQYLLTGIREPQSADPWA